MQRLDTVALSAFIHAQLDLVGFNKDRVRQRVAMYNKRSTALSSATKEILNAPHIEKIVVGSRREGLALEHSDTDILQINHGISCTDNMDALTEDKRVMFQMENQNTPPGYVLLCIHSGEHCDPVFYESIEYALVLNKQYLSSDKFVKKNEDFFFKQTGYVAANTKYTEHNGPSLPKKVFNTNEIDFVRAFPANSNALIQTWFNRSPDSEWPSKETKTEITSLPIYVVPVGKLDSENRALQWRISFTPAEIHLVHSLNDTQTKILVCLRLLCKHIFSPICSTMSSYLMKNVVFWLSERKSMQDFDEHLLFNRLIDALFYIRNGIREKRISNYMIMERNLLEGKLLDRSIQDDLNQAITDVIEQLPDALLMCMRYYHDKDSLQLMFPNLYSVVSLLKTEEEQECQSIKIIHAMTQDDLTNLTYGYYKSSNIFMILWFDLWYIVLPYIRKYGWKSMLFDFYLGKFSRIVQNEMTNIISPYVDGMTTREAVSLNINYEIQVLPSTTTKPDWTYLKIVNENFNDNIQALDDKAEGIAKQHLYEISARPLNDRTAQASNQIISLDYKIIPKWLKSPTQDFLDYRSASVDGSSLSEFISTTRKTHTVTETVTVPEVPKVHYFQVIFIWIFSVFSKCKNMFSAVVTLTYVTIFLFAIDTAFQTNQGFLDLKEAIELFAVILFVVDVSSNNKAQLVLQIIVHMLKKALLFIYKLCLYVVLLLLVFSMLIKKGDLICTHFDESGSRFAMLQGEIELLCSETSLANENSCRLSEIHELFCWETSLANETSCRYLDEIHGISCDQIQICFKCN